MPNFIDFLMVLGMIALRFGGPLLVIVGIGYLLKRLDRRWEAEAREYAAKQAAEQPAVQPETPRPTVPARKPIPAPAPLPFIIPPAVQKDQRVQLQPGMTVAASQACWDVKGCGDTKKATCAAPQHPEQPCWQARFDAEGHVPEECVSCDIFQRYPVM